MIQNKYKLRGAQSILFAILRELRFFFKGALGNLFSPAFLLILLPLILLWEILPRYGLMGPIIPPFSTVIAALGDLVSNRGFLNDIGDSMSTFFRGVGLAILIAIPLGLLTGWNIGIRKRVLPLFQMLAPIPAPAWVPITIVLFGIGAPMQVFLIFLGAFYPILFNTFQGVKDTDSRYLASARAFGASEFTLITRVYLWSALGAIIMSVRTGVAAGLVMLLVAEMYGGNTGIGFVMNEAQQFFQVPIVIASMVTLGMIGWFLIEVLKYIEVKLAVWKGGR
ncbi:MAG: ABC transporter permease [Defluviitaleaceae bacterium]|nr:ABC transporter permease [Defluviitaleaceae bacterium]